MGDGAVVESHAALARVSLDAGVGNRYEISEFDEHDADAVGTWTRRFCSTTLLTLIRSQYGEVDDRSELARLIARKVCRVAKKSGVPEAKGAVVVDGGGVELQHC